MVTIVNPSGIECDIAIISVRDQCRFGFGCGWNLSGWFDRRELSRTSSPQTECLWNVEPVADVYAELSWTDSQADFDLHMTTVEDGLFLFDSDCCWCNAEPNWSSTADANPVLLSDSEDGVSLQNELKSCLQKTASISSEYIISPTMVRVSPKRPFVCMWKGNWWDSTRSR